MRRTVMDHPASILIGNSQEFARWSDGREEGSIGVDECYPYGETVTALRRITKEDTDVRREDHRNQLRVAKEL